MVDNGGLVCTNPSAYPRDIIAKLAGDWPSARLAELMPAAWAAAQKSRGSARSPNRRRLSYRRGFSSRHPAIHRVLAILQSTSARQRDGEPDTYICSATDS